uniref:Pyrroline-5-carboxylate reductase 3 n=1 Tax=Eptatretus burgeri TaxID=7764 RepID=A0A8C4N4D3_EPTBU
MRKLHGSRNIFDIEVAGAHVTKRNIDVVERCKVVFIATKPAVVQSVLQEISQHVTADHLIVSVAAGIKISSLEKDLLHQPRVIRMMPNTACSVQKGATVFSLGMWCKQGDALLLQKLLTPCGFVAEVPESCIDVHTGMSGSGVAYGLVFAEALADGAVKMGMTRDLANKIAAQTLIGAGMMLLESGQHVGLLKDNVVSPGGTTSHGLHQLEKGCFRATVINAVEAATMRSQFLSNQ